MRKLAMVTRKSSPPKSLRFADEVANASRR
uniref:Pco080956 n=1 Tax=Arundo donax TaxID=35708 RepID=A0A0A9HU88_ARUDO